MSQEYKLVPVVPTAEMITAGMAVYGATARYNAMLAAAPVQPAGVDFGFDDRSVRVSQEAYSIFIAREAGAKAQIARLQAEVSALQQRLTIADQRVDDLSWIAKSGYMEGWEMGWVERHTDHNNEKRVMPWAPPRQVMDREWLTSEVRAALNPTAPAATGVSFVCVVDETCGGDAASNGESQ